MDEEPLQCYGKISDVVNRRQLAQFDDYRRAARHVYVNSKRPMDSECEGAPQLTEGRNRTSRATATG
jgi:hypothetical protein